MRPPFDAEPSALALLCLLAGLVGACASGGSRAGGGGSPAGEPSLASGAATPDPEYAKSIDEWHARRVERLKNPNGWLALVGLFPLPAGDHRFGSAESCDLVFPAKAPPLAGVLHVTDAGVEVVAEPGAAITRGGEPVTRLALTSDADGDPTVLEMGSFRFYVIDREGELFIRLKDTESEELAAFDGVDRYPVDPGWRVVGTFERYDPPRPIDVPNVLGGDFHSRCPGAAVFRVGKKTYRLEPMEEDEDGFFIVFGDETNGTETYGGGRFLYVDPPDAEGRVVLDFNKAYDPPCVFTPFATCPLPHAANQLNLRVEAGEKMWGEAHR